MNQVRILISDPIDELSLNAFQLPSNVTVDYKPKSTFEDLLAIIPHYDALIVRSKTKVTPELIQAAKKIRIIARAGIGVDNIHLDAAKAANIKVVNTPLANRVSTAEHALSLLLSLARKIPFAHKKLCEGVWGKSEFQGVEFSHKNLGIIGFGNIGQTLAELVQGFHMRLFAYDPHQNDAVFLKANVERMSLETLLEHSDFVSLHVVLNADTHHLLDARRLKHMKKNALLVNASRGGVVDESALIDALNAEQLGGVALDVFEEEPLRPNSPLINHPKVLLTPHLGASTDEAQKRVISEALKQVCEFFNP